MVKLVGKIDISRARLNFWDLGGQRDLHSIWEKYYSECHAIIFVVDSTDKERIEECKDVFCNLQHNFFFILKKILCLFFIKLMLTFVISIEKIITNDEVEGVPILMLANKQDLPNSLKIEEIKEIFNKIALNLGARDSRVLPVSALEG